MLYNIAFCFVITAKWYKSNIFLSITHKKPTFVVLFSRSSRCIFVLTIMDTV